MMTPSKRVERLQRRRGEEAEERQAVALKAVGYEDSVDEQLPRYQCGSPFCGCD